MLAVLSFKTWSQNLVLNGGFEKLDTCPVTLGEFYPSHWFGTHGSKTTPDLFSTCSAEDAYCSPKSYIINVVPFEGESYVGLVGYNPHDYYREYVSTRLKEPLIAGEIYVFSVSITQPRMALYYINELGVVFTEDSAKPEKLMMELVMEPDIVIEDGEFLQLSDVWSTVKVKYKAKGGELYMHLGCFLSDEQLLYRKYQNRVGFSKNTGYRDAYYVLDNVSLLRVEEEIVYKPTKTIVFDDINFETGEFSSSEKEFEQFSDLINYLKENPEVRVIIEGHTDDIGEADDNQELSEERALFVKSFFQYNAVSNPIQAIGYGEEKPLVANNSNENRAKNRRVVIHLFED